MGSTEATGLLMLSQLKCDKTPRDAAAAASDSPQSIEPQVDLAQTIAAPQSLQKHLTRLSKACQVRWTAVMARGAIDHYDAALQRDCDAFTEDLPNAVETVTEGSFRYWFCQNLRLQAQMHACHMQL